MILHIVLVSDAIKITPVLKMHPVSQAFINNQIVETRNSE